MDKAKFRAVVAMDYPLNHHFEYEKSGAEVRFRSTSQKWWMGSDRWHRPLRGTDALKRIIFACQLWRMMVSCHARILHVNLLSRDSWVDLAVAKCMGVRTVGHVQSLLSQRFLNKRCLDLCDVVICVSDCVAHEVARLTDVPTIERIYNPISVDRAPVLDQPYDAKFKLGLNSHIAVISSVAMLDPRKGHDTAISAFAKISADFPDATLLIVGGVYSGFGNAEQERLQKLATDLGVGPRVIFKGYISEMREIYEASDIVLALSKDGEAFGRVTAEAAGHGCVVIATAVGATPELIQDGITGFLVPPNNSEAVAEICRRVLLDEELSRKIGMAGIEHVAQNFNPDKIVRQTEVVYERLLRQWV